MDNGVIIRNATIEDISTIELLARQIWPVAYSHLMSAEKLEYMLQLIYSHAALKTQMEKQGHIFLLSELNDEAVGFASFSDTKENGVYKLHKIYVNPAIQGKGLGKKFITTIIEKIKKSDATALQLSVKRDNPAKFFYEKMGFVVIREEDIDIGNGYFMNDYVMEKNLR